MKKKTTAAIVAALCTLGSIQISQAAMVSYNVTQTYNQVVYDSTTGADTEFTGSFDFDTDTRMVTNFSGLLSQVMVESNTGTPTYVSLDYQLSSVSDGMGGQLVSVFAQNTTDVFLGGGFATGGKTTYGNENAYITIYVNLLDPAAAITDDQINNYLAYADCTPGGLMGSGTCMTGWVDLSSGVPAAGGTMRGTYPITQTITAVSAVPVPAAVWLLGSGLIGLVGAGRRKSISK
ncbi:MAG: VPLPA-CTERM sorting domain-containing protein [Gammaproteobacteria bacterium]|nr:VPLPA-CTERM sorting domain-containing protein [Gammaproteobacteria bacterium]